MIKELIKLYAEYLNASVKERTHEIIDLDTNEKKKVEFKGDFDGFMRWLNKKEL